MYHTTVGRCAPGLANLVFHIFEEDFTMTSFRDLTLRSGLVAAIIIAAVLTCTATTFGQEQPAQETTTAKLGQIQKRTYDFKAAGKEMEYALFVPSSYKKDKATPLMVALHGLHSNPHQIIRYPGLTQLAEKHGYIVVAPMGYNSRGWYGSRGQTSPRNTPENLGELSEKDVMNVLEIVRGEFNVDPNRIYLMGHSMGGGGTWHLGLKYPKLWAALAPIAPAIYRSTDALETIKHIPVIVVQGAKDPLVKADNTRRWVAKMKELEMDHTYIEDPDGGHVMVAFENLPKIFEFCNLRKKKPKPAE
ncbi:MAG: prolyl oligopeptidase family serine peptidase [Candidatus Nealsonbacteria bacterium]|nr:prolyl oligopeptidase family serine peptidase [Candidatus Nealsonbacteria bacterium]